MRRYTARFQTCHKLSSLGAENDDPYPLKELMKDFSFRFGSCLLLRNFHAAFQRRLTTAFMGSANTF